MTDTERVRSAFCSPDAPQGVAPMETALPAVDRPVGIHELREIVRRSYLNREVDDQSLGALADEIDRAMGLL